MKVNLKRAVDNLAKKDMKFLQPLFEAITNSLEANASEVVVNFDTETLATEEIKPKIIGFTVIDNGEGFTKKNRESFLELWSTVKFGCKGSGRITWLKVFENIDISSDVFVEKNNVAIHFTMEYDDKIFITSANVKKNLTTIKFSNVTDKYFDGKGVDNREIADINELNNIIQQNLLKRLFLLKNKNISFKIILNLNGQQKIISNDTIPDLLSDTMSIYGEITKITYDFELFYHFIDDNKNSKKVYYCADDRIVKEEDDDSLKFSCALPNKTSFDMLVCSSYLDERVNDSRDDFPSMSNNKSANIASPLLFKDIKVNLLEKIHEILLNKFPNLTELNKEEEKKAIEANPHLASYIMRNKDMVKSVKSLTTKAEEQFKKDKEVVRSKFEKLLKDKSIDEKAFVDAVNNLSEVAAAELGEYILYRENIIKALNDSLLDIDKKEAFIHNIFMPKRTKTFSDDNNKQLLSNLWLLDDKFMTYSYAASDSTIESIKNDIAIKNEEKFKNKNRPDVTIFFNDNSQKNIIMIEFKGANADKNEKNKALTELPDDVAIIKKHIPNVNTVWSYIITTIDDDFKFSIENQDFKKLFTADSQYCAYYKYFNNQNAHEYILDLNTITVDAFARNKTFLNILKK